MTTTKKFLKYSLLFLMIIGILPQTLAFGHAFKQKLLGMHGQGFSGHSLHNSHVTKSGFGHPPLISAHQPPQQPQNQNSQIVYIQNGHSPTSAPAKSNAHGSALASGTSSSWSNAAGHAGSEASSSAWGGSSSSSSNNHNMNQYGHPHGGGHGYDNQRGFDTRRGGYGYDYGRGH